jgi:hypothetical protein
MVYAERRTRTKGWLRMPSHEPVRVFISCPSDLKDQRRVVEQTLAEVNAEPEFAARVSLVPYAYENIVPARVGMDAQDVVNSYMLRPEDADLFICMFWHRMGTEMTRFLNPATGQPYQSGTEYEFLTAYAAAQQAPTPVILLYRCTRPVDEPKTDEDRRQRARVAAFFERFTPGGDLKGLYIPFADDDALRRALRQDVARVLRDDLLPLIARRERAASAGAAAGPLRRGLPPLPAGYVPREEALATLRKALLGSHAAVGVVAETTLHGMGGLGKTVLARAICDDPAIQATYPDGVLWATVGQHPDLARLQREWIQALGGDVTAAASPESGRAEIERLIGDRALLLVLDDIWQARDAAALTPNCPHCRVLVTTRDADQTPGAALVPLELMRRDESRALLREAARGRITDSATLDAIAERLGALPLALQVVGALLGLGMTWPEVQAALDAGELREMHAGQRSLFAAMDLSVAALPPDQRTRYRELVIFPADEPLLAPVVARLWQRTGGMSAFAAKRLFLELQDRSLIQAGGQLHDLQVDYLRAETTPQQRRDWQQALIASYGPPESWATLPDDEEERGYSWHWLAWHLKEAGRLADLHDLLIDAAYLRGKIERLGSGAVVADLTLLPDDATLRATASAVRAGKEVLEAAPAEVRNQVFGRTRPPITLHDSHPPAQPRFDLLWPSLLPADDALRQVFSGHTDWVRGCAFSPDGRLALSASDDGTLRLWEVGSGQSVRVFSGHTRAVWGCAFSPDGRLALSASDDRTLRLWEVGSGQEVARWTLDIGLLCAAFHPYLPQALTGDSSRGVHLLAIVGVSLAAPPSERTAAGTAAPLTTPAPATPGPATSTPAPATPAVEREASPVASAPRRRRWPWSRD